MIDSDFSLALENPSWIHVLRAYHSAQQEPESPESVAPQAAVPAVVAEPEDGDEAAESEEGGGKSRRTARWLARIHQFEGVAKEDLSRIHGRLIAYGFLKCDLAEKTAEVVYQVTLAGKQLLNVATNMLSAELDTPVELAAAA